MRTMTIVAIATMLATASAFGQSAGSAGSGTAPLPAKPGTAHPVHATPARPAAASTPESRSAAALALSHEPTFDEGTAQRIREAALSYSDIAVRGGWPAIPAEAKFVPGAQGPHDDLLRQRLLISGDLAPDKQSGAYDEFVTEAVKSFQLRHGLAATGTMTPRTLAALNIPVQKRIKQLEASLERLANMDFAFGQRYVVVNLPATFAALGAVKIDMPNPYSVYMHDTNQRNLFSDDYRFDSHGCSRVDNVRDLAAWLLKDLPHWSRAAIDAAIATGQREDIHLPRKVPVAWIYLTGWMTKDQTVQFRNDIYDQDVQLLEATAEEAAFFNQAGNHPLTAHLAQ